MVEKLVKVQSELKCPKNQYNSFGGFKYRSCEDVLEAVKPILAKYNIALVITDDIVQVGDRFYVKATATLYDVETGKSISTSAFAREALSKTKQDDSQITGTASSYARKYALNGLFLIDDAKDPDSDEYQKEQNARSQKAEKKTPAKKSRITEQQISEIYELLDITGSNMQQMLAACKVNAVEDMDEKAAARCIEIMKKKL